MTFTNHEIAEVAHEMNRAYCQALEDDSQVPWSAATEDQRNSCVKGVIFHRANPNAGPEASHENWMRQKRANGWIYGWKKDEVKKTHHCLVPFSELPQEQQAKDFLFRQVVHSLVALGNK